MGDEIEDVPAPSGGLTSFINRGIAEGSSMRSIASEARSAGMRFGDETFRNLYHAQENEWLTRTDIQNFPMDQVPGQDMYQQADWGRPGTYYTWIRGQSRFVGTTDIMNQFFVVDSDHPQSPDEAIADLLGRLDSADTAEGIPYPIVRLGFDAWGFTWVPPRR